MVLVWCSRSCTHTKDSKAVVLNVRGMYAIDAAALSASFYAKSTNYVTTASIYIGPGYIKPSQAVASKLVHHFKLLSF